MAKKSRKQRAKAKKRESLAPQSTIQRVARPAPVLELVAHEREHEAPTSRVLEIASAPILLLAPEEDEDVDVEVCVPSERDVEEALAAYAEEQRASQRVSVAVDIHMSSDSHFFSGLSGDISEGGLFLSTYRALAVGSAIDLEFSLPGTSEPVHARGEVRWLREHSAGQPQGVGIAFDYLDDGDRERIHRFCTMRPPLYYEDVG